MGGRDRSGGVLALCDIYLPPQSLLGISPNLADRFKELLVEDPRLDRIHLRRQGEYSERELLRSVCSALNTRPTQTCPLQLPHPHPARPGVSRLSFTYFMSDEVVEYVKKAVTMVAKHGWKLLPLVSGLALWACVLLSGPPHPSHSV